MHRYNRESIEWISSLSGFQGGNPSSEIWFCGLEYQGNDLSIIDNKLSWFSLSEPPFLKDCEYTKPENGGQVFNQCIKMIANFYYGKELNNINPFSKHGNIFKLNLYSLPQKATGEFFDEETFHKTGILTKSELRSLSMENGLEGVPSRFDNFKRLLELNKEKVKVIVGCSRGAMLDFVIAFGKKEEFFRCKNELENNQQAISISGKKNNYITWCMLESGHLLFIIPFLGGKNPSFKSVENMKLVSERIKNILQNYS